VVLRAELVILSFVIGWRAWRKQCLPHSTASLFSTLS
jgi:hypothetical protein